MRKTEEAEEAAAAAAVVVVVVVVVGGWDSSVAILEPLTENHGSLLPHRTIQFLNFIKAPPWQPNRFQPLVAAAAAAAFAAAPAAGRPKRLGRTPVLP